MPKRTRRTVLTGECREFVVRLREYFERENQNGGPLLPLSQVCDRVADALGIGRVTVVRISKEKYGERSSEYLEGDVERVLQTPNKKRKRASPVTDIDDLNADAIRSHANSYYARGEYPTLTKLSVSLEDAGLFKGSLSSLCKVLKKIGVGYVKVVSKKKIVMKRDCNFKITCDHYNSGPVTKESSPTYKNAVGSDSDLNSDDDLGCTSL